MIKKNCSLLLMLFYTVIQIAFAADAPKWKVELNDSVQTFDFLHNGKYLFFNSGEQAWLYDATTGEKVWEVKVKDYEKKGVHQLVGERYLVSTGKGIKCYDAVTGKLAWQKEYKDIDQDDFTGLEFMDNTAVLRYGDTHLGINLTNGSRLWWTSIRYNRGLVELGTFNYRVLNDQKKLLLMEKGDKIGLHDFTNGKKLLTLEDYEINTDLIEEKRSWMYVGPEQKCVLLALDDGAAVIDVANNKQLARKKFSIDAEHEILVPTQTGCAVFGEDRIIHFDFGNGVTFEIPLSIDDVRTYQTYTIGEKDILVISAKNKMFAIDLHEARMLWETPKNDQRFLGFAHRYINRDGNNIIITYASTVSQDMTATYLYLLSMDALRGTLNYQTPVALWKGSLSDISHPIGKHTHPHLDSSKSYHKEHDIKVSFGYDNLGFDYAVEELSGNLLVSNINNGVMLNPDTKQEGGEGYCLVNASTGAILYKSYYLIKQSGSSSKTMQVLAAHSPQPLVIDSIAYVCGNARVVAIDLRAGNKLWTVEKELQEGYPVDIAVFDSVVYIKFGLTSVKPEIEKKALSLEYPIEKDPYGFAAIDAQTGKLLWRTETKEDPGILLPQFSIKNYYEPSTQQLYLANQEKLYSLRLRRNGGKYVWILELDNSTIGEIPIKKIFAISETWLNTVPLIATTTTSISSDSTVHATTDTGRVRVELKAKFIEDEKNVEAATTYTSLGNMWELTARRCLRVLYDGQRLLLFGRDGIGMVDAITGKTQWVVEWDYDNDAVQYTPRVLNNRIVYCIGRKLTCIDLETGKRLWQLKVAEKTRFFTSPDERFLFAIDEDAISGYQL